MLVNREWFVPPAISELAYCTLGVQPELTASKWLCRSCVIWPGPEQFLPPPQLIRCGLNFARGCIIDAAYLVRGSERTS
jgi:hypothetical protein